MQGRDLRNDFELEADSADIVPDDRIWGLNLGVEDDKRVDENALLDSALLEVIEKGKV